MGFLAQAPRLCLQASLSLSFQQDFVTKLDALTGGPSLDNLKNTPPHTNIMSNSKDHYSFVRETAINLFSILDQAQILLTQLLSRTKSTTSSDCNNNLDNNLVMRLEASLQEVHKRLDKLESPHSSQANPTYIHFEQLKRLRLEQPLHTKTLDP